MESERVGRSGRREGDRLESKGGGRATDRLSESWEEWAAEEAAGNPGPEKPVEVPERRTGEKVRIDVLLRDDTLS